MGPAAACCRVVSAAVAPMTELAAACPRVGSAVVVPMTELAAACPRVVSAVVVLRRGPASAGWPLPAVLPAWRRQEAAARPVLPQREVVWLVSQRPGAEVRALLQRVAQVALPVLLQVQSARPALLRVAASLDQPSDQAAAAAAPARPPRPARTQRGPVPRSGIVRE
jgi:hypothetical protein